MTSMTNRPEAVRSSRVISKSSSSNCRPMGDNSTPANHMRPLLIRPPLLVCRLLRFGSVVAFVQAVLILVYPQQVFQRVNVVQAVIEPPFFPFLVGLVGFDQPIQVLYFVLHQ